MKRVLCILICLLFLFSSFSAIAEDSTISIDGKEDFEVVLDISYNLSFAQNYLDIGRCLNKTDVMSVIRTLTVEFVSKVYDAHIIAALLIQRHFEEITAEYNSVMEESIPDKERFEILDRYMDVMSKVMSFVNYDFEGIDEKILDYYSDYVLDKDEYYDLSMKLLDFSNEIAELLSIDSEYIFG